MNEKTTNFRNVNSKFDLFFKNAVSCEVPEGYPKAYPEQEFTEDQVVNVKRSDGLVIEICDWHDGGIYVTDISVYECQLESEPRARLILSHLCSFESEPPKHRSSNDPDGRSPHSYLGHRI